MAKHSKATSSITTWIAIAGFVIAGAGVAATAMDNQNLKRELAGADERNKGLFSLLVKQISEGCLTLKNVAPYVTNVEEASIGAQATAAIQAKLPFDLETNFYPSGWMGDGEFGAKYVSLRREKTTLEGTNAIAIRIDYRPGPKAWAGLYWQYPDRNWGEKPGRTLTGARKISFYARGENGGEIVEFKAGGIKDGRYKDSFEVSLGKLALEKSWRKYTIDLSKENLSSVIGGFAWVASAADNHGIVVTHVASITID